VQFGELEKMYMNSHKKLILYHKNIVHWRGSTSRIKTFVYV